MSDKNIREKMVTPLELIFMALAEESVRMNVIKDDAVGFEENLVAVQKGAFIAGEARKRLEAVQNVTVLSSDNFLHLLKKGDSKKELE